MEKKYPNRFDDDRCLLVNPNPMVSHRNLLPHLRSFDKGNEKHILVKAPNPRRNNDSDSVTMPTSFMTGSIVGKRFYKKVMTREADDGNGWTVMLDYRTLKTPSMRPLKLPSLIGLGNCRC